MSKHKIAKTVLILEESTLPDMGERIVTLWASLGAGGEVLDTFRYEDLLALAASLERAARWARAVYETRTAYWIEAHNGIDQRKERCPLGCTKHRRRAR